LGEALSQTTGIALPAGGKDPRPFFVSVALFAYIFLFLVEFSCYSEKNLVFLQRVFTIRLLNLQITTERIKQ
jgi:hypothetical protein